MKQDKLFKVTRKAIERPLEFTQTLLEKTEKVRTPSPRVDKIGRTIGAYIGIGLLLTGAFQLFVGKIPWAIGTASAGGVTILSNLIYPLKNKK
ncbi:hypothetical protein [Anaerocolumna sp. MB42-C2]|uniref:hypothetical protein n=1 Tax=Anaerocolumna sp. MB42-C2 TaxID=3070997 RepID=UPI0027DFBBFA|nr:hypothetical protein [Anaerocolumna sp. MB42-C2]WMJ86834.1 hypothetical protein RBU59_22790 [Anaerocolumna sp. MB42-C2]